LSSIRGLALSPDGRLLYMADYERGLIGFDLAAGKPFDVPVPKTLALGGIDGLLQWHGELVAVQNGMNPTRLMRFSLSDDGRSIADVHPIAANQSDLTVPTLAALAGDTLYVIANSQKANYDRFGLLIERNKLQATKIYATAVNYELPKDAATPASTTPTPASKVKAGAAASEK
jgi:sugar lactone lactonase YvrE